jgi:hypothetical protein
VLRRNAKIGDPAGRSPKDPAWRRAERARRRGVVVIRPAIACAGPWRARRDDSGMPAAAGGAGVGGDARGEGMRRVDDVKCALDRKASILRRRRSPPRAGDHARSARWCVRRAKSRRTGSAAIRVASAPLRSTAGTSALTPSIAVEKKMAWIVSHAESIDRSLTTELIDRFADIIPDQRKRDRESRAKSEPGHVAFGFPIRPLACRE